MRLAQDNRFGGRAPRVWGSEFQALSSQFEVRSFPGRLGQRTWKDDGRSGAARGYASSPVSTAWALWLA
jgi:hypothetical protein